MSDMGMFQQSVCLADRPNQNNIHVDTPRAVTLLAPGDVFLVRRFSSSGG